MTKKFGIAELMDIVKVIVNDEKKSRRFFQNKVEAKEEELASLLKMVPEFLPGIGLRSTVDFLFVGKGNLYHYLGIHHSKLWIIARNVASETSIVYYSNPLVEASVDLSLDLLVITDALKALDDLDNSPFLKAIIEERTGKRDYCRLLVKSQAGLE